jgi:uncharacterized repeat protein (TIGR02543 family)
MKRGILMKKIIRFTLLIFMIAGVFIFAPGERVAAAQINEVAYDIYAYTASDTTHEIPSTIDWNNTLVFIGGEKVFEMGSPLNPGYGDGQWSINTVDWNQPLGPVILFKSWPSEDYIQLSNDENKEINNLLGLDFIVIELVNSSEYYNLNFYTFTDFEVFDAEEAFSIIDSIYYTDSNYIKVITSGVIQYDQTFMHTVTRIEESGITRYALHDFGNMIDFLYIYSDGYIDLTFGYNLLIIEYIPPQPAEYTITFNTNGGSAVDPIVVTEGALLGETIWDPSVETTKSGYTFDDWYKNAGLTIPVTEVDTVTADITLYAGWIQNIVNYTVTFNTNGGSYIAPQSIESGDVATRPTDPLKTGYTFNGWYAEMFFINLYNFNSAVEDNITLYAQWTLAEEPIEEEKDSWDVFVENLPWIILGIVFIAIIFKK